MSSTALARIDWGVSRMLGIKQVASYLPAGRRDNGDKIARFEMDLQFLDGRIGVRRTAVASDGENCSDLCLAALAALRAKADLDIATVDAIVVVTQNPDYQIPHASAVVHGRLGASESCACFDISLGCSGFVYALSIVTSFMEANGLKNGLLFTADPYSKIIDETDRNTSLLFGDGACVTWIAEDPRWKCSNFTFGTIGQRFDGLIVRDGKLSMDSRSIFNFAASYVPKDIEAVLRRSNLAADDIDFFLIHQGSKFIVDTITKRLGVPPEKVPFIIADHGNTCSSTIPMLLETLPPGHERVIASGFGVGLSWSSCLMEAQRT
jgi:3-oxoacyl-[acyl-carrier-protein] synthase-3